MVGVPTLHVTTGGCKKVALESCTACRNQAADSPFTEDGVQRMTDRSFGVEKSRDVTP